jgi:hypothetical protein
MSNNPNFFFYVIGYNGYLTAAFEKQLDAQQYAKKDSRRKVVSRSELNKLFPEFREDFLKSQINKG